MDQRLLDEISHKPGAHGCLRLVQHPQKGSPALLFPQSLQKLKISPGGGIQHHELACGVGPDRKNVTQRVFLGLVEILHHRAGGDDACVVIPQPQPVQASHPEMFL